MSITAVWVALSMVNVVSAAALAIGAAPKGDTSKVAEKIIKKNFPSCKKMGATTRKADGSIKATCSGVEFLVFTAVNPKDNKTMELAMNCTAAKAHLNISC
ncbi:hypothetical protein [Massilia aquatica]|uniref:Uncharacterized protein n=1 Tax=Massilia aquatica TaxID=2609000 RepID=A0ABX0MBA0_9BURK|nr:hypothetical protein [Massilia aquatica]NHZ41341.1 hypothetical protein [Massilia aquatica]